MSEGLPLISQKVNAYINSIKGIKMPELSFNIFHKMQKG